MSNSRLVVIGESLVDVIVEPSGTRTARPGGSPMNVAIGVARLGVPSTLVTALGADEHGDLVRAHIAQDAVTLIERGSADLPTIEAIATIDETGAAEYAFRLTNPVRGAASAIPDETMHLHVGSLTAVTDEEWGSLLAVVKAMRGRATVSYDPNCRPDIGVPHDEYRVRVEEFAANADIIKASDEDLAWLYRDETIDEVAARWLAGGARLVVITRGGAGPIGFTPGSSVAVPARGIIVTDTVGAGDSFMAAMLAWSADHGMLGPEAADVFDTAQVEELLDVAACAAAITCTRVGANPPTRVELDAAIRA
ncbi:carbohydrate kinase family protein [Microbacterium keratanolyticum]